MARTKISYDEAKKILDLAGGSIRHWARNIRDVRATHRQVIEPGDLTELYFEAPAENMTVGMRYTPQLLIERLQDADVGDITPERADQLLQTAIYGRVLYTGELNAHQRDELEKSLAGMPVRSEEDL